MHNLIIDVRWVMGRLLEEKRVSQGDANIIGTTPRERHELNWHPFQLIAKYQLEDAQQVGQLLDVPYLSRWLATTANMPFYPIDPLKVNVSKVTAVMSTAFAERHNILAVEAHEDELVIACAQPFVNEWQQGLKQTHPGKVITQVMADPEELRRYMVEFYNLSRSISNAEGQQLTGITNFEQLLELGQQSSDANDQHIVGIVDWILQYAFEQRASDIHLEPRRELGKMRFRIDGVLHDVYELPATIMAAVTSRLKILSRLNVAEKRKPQDGRLKTVSAQGDEIELRISTLPTAFGEKMVMRIFDPDVLLRDFSQLGFVDEDFRQWQEMSSSPHGIILVTGPTGSGKTTTLYSTLKKLATSEVNVCTIEDPIEMVEDSFNQMQVQDAIGVGFAEGIKSLLRQDPDIIMIGEIRDLPTAEMAIQAALTGHLVLSTLHTNDAPSSITRLLDLGVPGYMISSTVIGVMAQRLVRTLCQHCKEEAEMDEDVWKNLVQPWKAKKPAKINRPKGCLKCRDTGYQGRMGLYEIMPLSPKLQQLLNHNAPLVDIKKQAYIEGMKSLRLSGAQKIAAGKTTVEEVMRVTPATIL